VPLQSSNIISNNGMTRSVTLEMNMLHQIHIIPARPSLGFYVLNYQRLRFKVQVDAVRSHGTFPKYIMANWTKGENHISKKVPYHASAIRSSKHNLMLRSEP
jgi:hypothetical protein